MSSDALFDMKDDEHPEKSTTECWCGGAKGKRVSVCYYCYEMLPREVKDGLHKQYGLGYEEAYESAIKHLAALNGYGDDTRTAAQRAGDEALDDVMTGLPGFLQELLTGQAVEKVANASEMDNVYANVLAGLPAELQKALLGE